MLLLWSVALGQAQASGSPGHAFAKGNYSVEDALRARQIQEDPYAQAELDEGLLLKGAQRMDGGVRRKDGFSTTDSATVRKQAKNCCGACNVPFRDRACMQQVGMDSSNYCYCDSGAAARLEQKEMNNEIKQAQQQEQMAQEVKSEIAAEKQEKKMEQAQAMQQEMAAEQQAEQQAAAQQAMGGQPMGGMGGVVAAALAGATSNPMPMAAALVGLFVGSGASFALLLRARRSPAVVGEEKLLDGSSQHS